MAIYTFDEVKNSILKSIPDEAETDIVWRALTDVLRNSIDVSKTEDLEKILISLIPNGMRFTLMSEAVFDSVCSIALSRAKIGNISTGLRSLITIFLKSYMAKLYYNKALNKEWETKHIAELTLLAGKDPIEGLPKEVREIFNSTLNLSIEELKDYAEKKQEN